MRKLFIVTQNYPPANGGMPKLMQNLAERLSKTYDVKVLTFLALNTSPFFDASDSNTMKKHHEEALNGISIERFGFVNKYHRFIKVISHWMWKHKIPGWGKMKFIEYGPISPEFNKYVLDNINEEDTVIAGSYPLNFMHDLVKLRRRVGFNLILIPAIHPLDIYWFSNPEIYIDMNQADAIVCFTEYEKNFIASKGVEIGINVIGIGADSLFERIRPKKKHEGCVLTYIGSYGATKGIDDLIHAFQRIGYEFPSTRVIIAGAETQYTKVIKKQIRKLPKELQDRIVLKVNISEREKLDILAMTDIFVSVSGYESFGISFIEGWSQGIPVVSTRSGSTPYVIDENINGLLIDYKNVDELTLTLRELISDKMYRETLGSNGHKKVHALYNWDVIITRYSNIIEGVYGK